MNKLSEGRMEQVIIGFVSVTVILCATFLGYNSKVDASTILTSVATGLFGYSGMAGRNSTAKATVEVKKGETEPEDKE